MKVCSLIFCLSLLLVSCGDDSDARISGRASNVLRIENRQNVTANQALSILNDDQFINKKVSTGMQLIEQTVRGERNGCIRTSSLTKTIVAVNDDNSFLTHEREQFSRRCPNANNDSAQTNDIERVIRRDTLRNFDFDEIAPNRNSARFETARFGTSNVIIMKYRQRQFQGSTRYSGELILDLSRPLVFLGDALQNNGSSANNLGNPNLGRGQRSRPARGRRDQNQRAAQLKSTSVYRENVSIDSIDWQSLPVEEL